MNAIDILNSRNLKRTSCREGIIEVVMKSKHALSENEIRDRLVGNYDRTTFYRSFKTLEKHNIIHKIVINNQLIKYAIGDTSITDDDHAHFYCNDCQTVKCVDFSPVQKYQLPAEYVDAEVEVLIKGVCEVCKTRN